VPRLSLLGRPVKEETSDFNKRVAQGDRCQGDHLGANKHRMKPHRLTEHFHSPAYNRQPFKDAPHCGRFFQPCFLPRPN